MRLGWGTYGMKAEDPLAALPRLAALGYQAIEFTAAPGWPTAPERLDAAARTTLRAAVEQLGWPAPVLLDLLTPCAPQPERAAQRERFGRLCRLAADLHFGSEPALLTTTLGGACPSWDEGRDVIAEVLVGWADLAADHGAVLAIEPHVGGALDTPAKAAWLLAATAHPHLRLNFDISHFLVAGLDWHEAVATCAPHAVYAHVKDGAMVDGQVRFVLPGEGTFAWPPFLAELAAAGYDGIVTVEVSGMVWSRPDYDPWRAAQFCRDHLPVA